MYDYIFVYDLDIYTIIQLPTCGSNIGRGFIHYYVGSKGKKNKQWSYSSAIRKQLSESGFFYCFGGSKRKEKEKEK